MDAVGTAHADQPLVLVGQILEHTQDAVDALGQDGPGAGQEQPVGRVHDVRGRAAKMDVPGIVADLLLHGGQEGDDVVLGGLLDLEDAVQFENRPWR